MPLNDMTVRSAKAKAKPYRLSDERGLYLLVSATGSRLWRFDYRFLGRRLTMAMGQYPDVSLQRARERRDDARKLLSDGVDPSEHRKTEREQDALAQRQTFGLVVEEYLDLLAKRGAAQPTIGKHKWMLETLAVDLLKKPISRITPAEVLKVLRSVELSGRRESAVRLRAAISAVFALAMIDGRAQSDPTVPLRRALVAPVVEHYPAITVPKQFGVLLDTIDAYDGWPTIRAGLQLLALTFVRPGALRAAEWKEIDLEDSIWHIPSSHMKRITGRPALPLDVPLSPQARQVLRSIRRITGNGRLIFSSIRDPDSPLSENALNSALRRMGYGKEEMTSHGFRTSASTLLNESRRFREDVIEFQLAHVETNKVRGAYNRAQYWDERVEMMNAWADMCDEFRRL